MSARILSKQQGEIFLEMASYHPHLFEQKVKEVITHLDTMDAIRALRADLHACFATHDSYLSILPSRNAIGQYLSISGSQLPFQNQVYSILVEGHQYLEIPGASLMDGVNAAYDHIEKMMVIVTRLLSLLDGASNKLRFGPLSSTPFREIGLLSSILSLEQMTLMANTLQLEAGRIDLHQLRKGDAAIVLNTLRVKMGFNGNTTAIVYLHADGESEWYGLGGQGIKKKRDQVRHTADNCTPSQRIQHWLSNVGLLDA